jgi:hypothetical protein
LRQPHPTDPRRALLTTGQWLAHWLATRLRPRPATLRGYHQHIDQHLVPHLGGILLRELCLDDVQSAFAILARIRTRYGRARAAATLHRIRATLRVALNAAMRRGLIDTNPARHVELPPVSRPKAVVWTPARVAHWRATGDHPIVAVWTAHQSAQLQILRWSALLPLDGAATVWQRLRFGGVGRDLVVRPHGPNLKPCQGFDSITGSDIICRFRSSINHFEL